jgi:xanthine dehydrogenase large subunit
MSVVGKNVPHDSAEGHVSGESIYIDDMPFARNELLVDFYWSAIAHGKIKSIDLTAAAKVPGVVGLYTYKDLDGHNVFGPIIQDELLLAEDKVTFIGHPIVIIAAEDRKAIKEAKAKIVVDIEELKPIFSIDDAIAAKEFIGATNTIKRGDLEAGFDSAEHIWENVFVNGGQDHFYLESQAALAYPGENDSIVTHSSTQNPSEVQEVIAHCLGLQLNQVVCITKRMGGGFGGKECQATHPAVMASLVALKTKRPARLVYNKDDDMRVTGGRHPFQSKYKVGFTSEGQITALKADLFSNGGAYADLSTSVMGRAMCHVDNAYYLPSVEIRGTVCRTNRPPNTAFRGFGGPQGVALIENIMEEIAAYLGKDAYDVRKLNCYGINDRNVTPYGQVVTNNTLHEIFERLEVSSDYKNRVAAVEEFNRKSRTHLKGISMSAVKFGISFNTKFLNQANALVNVYRDGTVQVSTGATEMGQGVNTKIRQLVADSFAIPIEWVLVMATSTEKNNNTSATAASSATDLNGSAAVNACEKIRARLAECAAAHLVNGEFGYPASPPHLVFESAYVYDTRLPHKKVSFKELVQMAYLQRLSLGERGFYATPGVDFNWATGTGNPFLYFTNGCAVAEVLIDRFTGDLKIERFDILMDIGKPINPGIDKGQIVGAFIQGVGWSTTEELRYGPKGDLLSHSPTTYKIPNIQDIPDVFNVAWIQNDKNTMNIRGSKAVGEPPLLLGLCAFTAVKQALRSLSGESVPELTLPATNEEILTRIMHYRRAGITSPGSAGILPATSSDAKDSPVPA